MLTHIMQYAQTYLDLDPDSLLLLGTLSWSLRIAVQSRVLSATLCMHTPAIIFLYLHGFSTIDGLLHADYCGMGKPDQLMLAKQMCQRRHCQVLRHVIELVQDTWEWNQVELPKDAQQPSARDFACIVALEGGRLLIHGGLDAQERRLDDAWMFDTMT